jgi:hypothetical protein
MPLRNVEGGYQHLGVTSVLICSEPFFGNYLPDYTVSYSRRPQFKFSLLWKAEI